MAMRAFVSAVLVGCAVHPPPAKPVSTNLTWSPRVQARCEALCAEEPAKSELAACVRDCAESSTPIGTCGGGFGLSNHVGLLGGVIASALIGSVVAAGYVAIGGENPFQ